MKNADEIRSAVANIAGDPKVATTVAAATTSLGAAGSLQIIQGYLSVISLSIGILTAIVVLAIQCIKLVRNYKAWREEG